MVNKATLGKEVDGVIEYIYPKTSADMVEYTAEMTVEQKIKSIDTDITATNSRISSIVAQAGTDNTEIVDARTPVFTPADSSILDSNGACATLKDRLSADFSSLSNELQKEIRLYDEKWKAENVEIKNDMNDSISNITKNVDELKNDLGELIGIRETNNIPIGTYLEGYYTGTVGSIINFTELINAGERAYSIDLTDYIGINIEVKYSTSNTVSQRIIALCDTNGIIKSLKRENAAIDGVVTFTCIPSDEYHNLYISLSNEGSDLSISSFFETSGKIDEYGERILNIENTVSSIKHEYIQPHDFPILPYKVIKTNNGYILEDNIYDVKNIRSFRQIYVDSVNGSDDNNGTSQNTAYKTLKKALTVSIGTDSRINIIGDSVFYADDLYGEFPNRNSLAIIGENKPKLIYGELPTWTVYDSSNNTYSAAVSFTGKCCVDMANVGHDGLFEGMKAVNNVSAVVETENSYYIDNTTVYVHPISGNNASSVVILKSGYGVRWNHATSKTDHFLYMKNLNILGGYFDMARSSAYQVIGVKIEFFAEDCILQHNPMGDGFPHNGYDVSYNINCNVGFSNADCFNHHHSGCTVEQIQNSIIVDINCKAREAGYYKNTKQGNDNLFTCHDGENVLRLNCRGMTAPGPSFADVNGCRSVLIDCESYNNSYPELAINGAWQFNNVNAIKDGLVTLVNCKIYDNRDMVKLNSECDIEIMDTPVFDSMNITGKLSICNGI